MSEKPAQRCASCKAPIYEPLAIKCPRCGTYNSRAMFEDSGKQKIWERFEGQDHSEYMRQSIHDLIEAIWTFEWRGREDAEFDLVYEDDRPTLKLTVWVTDSDDDDEELKPLTVAQPVRLTASVGAEQQMRELVHWHVCHEVDERLSFNHELVFYPEHVPHPTRPGVFVSE